MNDSDAFDPTFYGERIADVYDDLYREVDEEAVGRLAEFAGEGRALELGIGTGRIPSSRARPSQIGRAHV